MYYEFQVQAKDAGRTLGDILTNREGMSSRTKKRLRLYGEVLRNGRPARLIERVSAFDLIKVILKEEKSALHDIQYDEKALPFEVLYSDLHYLAVNKPQGILSHPSVHDDRSVQHFLPPGNYRAVGRLDKTTSGILLLAKDSHAHHYAASRPSEKRYLALVHGKTDQSFSCDIPIRRSNFSYLTRIASPDGRPARTEGRLIAYDGHLNISLIELSLTSGRTHQIRVHMLWLGHPLLGDHLYGLLQLEDIYPGKGRVAADCAWDAEMLFQENQFKSDSLIERAALHASFLSFYHPVTKDIIEISASLPDDFSSVTSLFAEERSVN